MDRSDPMYLTLVIVLAVCLWALLVWKLRKGVKHASIPEDERPDNG